jgi:hypothetical protein
MKTKLGSKGSPTGVRNPLFLLVALSFLTLGGECLKGDARHAGDPELLQKLAKKWASQKSEVFSASIRFRRFAEGGYLKPCTQREIAREVAGVDFVKDTEAMQRLISHIFPYGKLPANVRFKSPPWTVIKFQMSGERRREEAADIGSTQIATPEAKIESNGLNKHIQLYAPGRSLMHVTELKDIRDCVNFHPSMAIRSVEGRVALIETGGDKLGHWEYRVDIDSGAQLECSFHRNGGRISEQHWQGGWTLFPGDVLLPRWKIDAIYDAAGKLATFNMFFVEDAVLNQTVPDAAFQLRAAEGATVFDRRVRRKITDFRLAHDTADIVAAAGNPLYRGNFPARDAAGSATPARRPIWGLLVLLNAGLLLIFVGFFVLRRRRRHG